MARKSDADERYNVRVLDRAIRLLSLLSDGKARSLTELSEEAGISSSTTFRLLATLASHRYVERDPRSGQYRVGLASLELARAYHEGNDIRRVALPELEKLRDETGETVHLGVLDEMEVVYLEKLPGHHAIGLMSSRVGGRSPAYCTGLGKVLLAYEDQGDVREHYERTGLRRFTDMTIASPHELMGHLAEVREQGYGLDQGEHEVEVRCVAAPIFGNDGKVVGAVSVSGPGGRMDPLAGNGRLIDLTRLAAKRISSRLGYSPVESERDATLSDGSTPGH